MRRLPLILAISVVVALATAFGALATLRSNQSATQATTEPSLDPSPVLETPVTRIAEPIRLQTRQTLDPLANSYVASVSADEALVNVPIEVAGFAGQPKAVYLGSANDMPVYVFRYDYCLPPAGGGGGASGDSNQPPESVDPCANGATYDALLSADTGEFIVAGQITNPSSDLST